MLNEREEKIRKRIDEFLDQKRFEEAATLAVHMAFLRIDPKELAELLVKAVKEHEERNANGHLPLKGEKS